MCPRGPSALMSRGDCAKAFISSVKLQGACTREGEDGEGPGPVEQSGVLALDCPDPSEAKLGHIPVYVPSQGGKERL